MGALGVGQTWGRWVPQPGYAALEQLGCQGCGLSAERLSSPWGEWSAHRGYAALEQLV